LEVVMRALFGGLIAVALLALYVYAIVTGIKVVDCVTTPNCTEHPLTSFTSGMTLVLTSVGGLVSALVISELSLTDPGGIPIGHALGSNVSGTIIKFVKVIAVLYVFVWLGAGLAAFVVGVMQHPTALQPLTDVGQAWLGLAAAAAYTYLGVKPRKDLQPPVRTAGELAKPARRQRR
jgi:hypothetical protein